MLDQVRLSLSETHAAQIEDKRKIPCELAAEMGIVSMGPDLAFEYHRQGKLIWRQVRKMRKDEQGNWYKTFACYAPDGRTLKEAGIPLSFWQEDDLLASSSLSVPRIITEGQFDACALRLAGFPIVGSVPNGANGQVSEGTIDPGEDNAFTYLWDFDEPGNRWRLKGGLEACERIILATDGDKPGLILRNELAIRLGRDRCWYVTYPEGCKDSNDVLIRYGAEEGVELLIDMVSKAKPIVPTTLVSFSEIPDASNEYARCGWPELHGNLKIKRPELMIVSGPPGDGKSQFVTALAANLAYDQKWRGAILQFEDDVERVREDLVSYHRHRTGKPRSTMETATDAEEPRKQAIAWVDDMFRTVAPDESLGDTRFDLEWLKGKITEAVRRHGCRFVIVDPWNEVEHTFHKGMTETQYLNDSLRDLKRLSRALQICLIIVTHPSAGDGREKEIEKWSLYSVSGGQAWNNKADHGIIVLRPDQGSPETFIKVAKSKRHLTMGRPGTAVMRYMPLKGTYDFVRVHE